jgi:hypothetical protein
VLAGIAVVVLAGAGTFAYLWSDSGAHAVPSSVAIQRFLQEGGTAGSGPGTGPAPGVYSYHGTGTESLTVPPKSQTEGPGIPGTVVRRAGGCFEFRLDFSDYHWQSWDYCVRDGALVSPSRAGYYNWDFVAFHVDDTSTFVCRPSITTVAGHLVPGASHAVACTGHNDHLSIGPVFMHGTSTLVRAADLTIGTRRLASVLVSEKVTFSGGQSGSNVSDTWFSVTDGLPLRGTWHTTVSTASPVGTSTLDAHGDFTLDSVTPQR